MEVEGGYISYYSKGVFEAVCKTHASCVVSRTVSKVTDQVLGRPRGGRPLGVMASWLSKHSCATKEEHWRYEHFSASYDERLLFRPSLQDSEEGRMLLSHERAQLDGEDIEPIDADLWEYMPRESR